MAKLTYRQRKRLPSRQFALERERKYPLDTINRARNALARVAQHGTRAEQKEVKREVYAKYPSLRPNPSNIKLGDIVWYKDERVRVDNIVGDDLYIWIPSRQEAVWIGSKKVDRVTLRPEKMPKRKSIRITPKRPRIG